MLAVAMMFLKANWKWVLVGILLASLVGYIETIKLERNHYKSQYDKTALVLGDLIKSSKAKEELLDASNKAITDRYANTLRDANNLIVANAKLNQENIANAKELASVKLSLNAIRLFNASKQSTSTTQEPANPVEGNDGTATSTSTAPVVDTLQDLLQVVNYNDTNHKACIKVVETWQKFWIDFTNGVDTSNNATSN